MKLAAIATAAALFALAPFQCPGDPDPQLRREESAPEAVWTLCEQLGRNGHTDARRDALRFLVRRYPNSRFAARARLELRQEAPPPQSQ